jgi:hypothetical protein
MPSANEKGRIPLRVWAWVAVGTLICCLAMLFFRVCFAPAQPWLLRRRPPAPPWVRDGAPPPRRGRAGGGGIASPSADVRTAGTPPIQQPMVSGARLAALISAGPQPFSCWPPACFRPWRTRCVLHCDKIRTAWAVGLVGGNKGRTELPRHRRSPLLGGATWAGEKGNFGVQASRQAAAAPGPGSQPAATTALAGALALLPADLLRIVRSAATSTVRSYCLCLACTVARGRLQRPQARPRDPAKEPAVSSSHCAVSVARVPRHGPPRSYF